MATAKESGTAGLTCRVWTVGHSTRKLEEFTHLLEENGIQLLADVLRYPGSRRVPQFTNPGFAEALFDHGVEYRHFPGLGGRRRPRPDSTNAVWRNEAFRGYADYMETEEFHAEVGKLLELASEKRTALMCAEAVWWRCHRALIADYLKARGVEVCHIMSATQRVEHPYTSPAHVVAGTLSYPAPA